VQKSFKKMVGPACGETIFLKLFCIFAWRSPFPRLFGERERTGSEGEGKALSEEQKKGVQGYEGIHTKNTKQITEREGGSPSDVAEGIPQEARTSDGTGCDVIFLGGFYCLMAGREFTASANVDQS